jgi:uncharacterized cupin superfamily protein
VKRVAVGDDGWLAVDPDDPPPYDAPFGKVRDVLGAQRLGGTVIVLAPGQAVCPYHWEAGEEEWLVVLSGSAQVRTPEGTTTVPQGHVACFPRGPEGAHRIANAGAEPARLLIVSESAPVAAAVYPDSGKVGVFTPDLRELHRRSDAVGYYDGEPGVGGG